jgi:cell division protein FtsB
MPLSPQHKLVLCALAGAVAMAASSLLDPKGLPRLRRLEADIARQELANRELREENARLLRTVKDLSPPLNTAVLQRTAREQLGFVRQDEVLFKFE